MPNWTPQELAAHEARRGVKPSVSEHPEQVDQLVKFQIKPSTDESKLNKTEKAYLAHLRAKYGPDAVSIQAITLKLGDDCRFTPDLGYIRPEDDRWVLVDVKGFQREDSLVKLKTAARLFRREFEFQIVKKNKNFGWDVEVVNP